MNLQVTQEWVWASFSYFLNFFPPSISRGLEDLLTAWLSRGVGILTAEFSQGPGLRNAVPVYVDLFKKLLGFSQNMEVVFK